MAVRMRLMRMGKKKQPVYRVVVVDGRSPRDGRYIEQIGRYDPRQEPSLVEIDNERAADWLSKGAQPSETVEKLLNISGAMSTMKVKTRGIHVVSAPSVPSADSDESAAVAAGAGEAGDSDTETPQASEEASISATDVSSEEE